MACWITFLIFIYRADCVSELQFFLWEGAYCCLALCLVIKLSNINPLIKVTSVRLESHFLWSCFPTSPRGWSVRHHHILKNIFFSFGGERPRSRSYGRWWLVFSFFRVMKLTGVNRSTGGKNLSQWHFVHQKSHMDWPRIEPGTPRWEAGD
jgi:hypothetical protein